MIPVLRALDRPVTALEAWFGRRSVALARPRAAAWALLLVPVLLGLMSVWMGQDSNWDLQNYHWYNPYALLNGRLDVDMAPGQFQSYFNPTIDLPYYLMAGSLPGPLVGFVMGFVQGLNFVLVAAIARRVLAAQNHADAGTRLPLLLAAAGVCGVGFLSELGNTMGDNLTSLLVLSSLLLLLRGWQDLGVFSARTLGLVLLSGALMGVGAGLKLTNAVYALALCLALLAAPLAPVRRSGVALLYGCGVVAGVLASAGWWWVMLWQRFGNPLFPQFNQIFHSPLAAPVGVIDAFHLPHNAVEALFWPFVFFRDFKRIGEIGLRPAIMPVLYAAALVFLAVLLSERIAGRRVAQTAQVARAQPWPAFTPEARFLLVFGLLAYLGWMKMFSIYRYLVPFELLAPLMLWLLVGRIAARVYAARIGGWLLAIVTVTALPVMTWGHVGWSKTGFAAAFPAFSQPASTIVLIAHGDPPMGWLAAFVPREVRVIALGLGVQEPPAYVARLQATIGSRPGPHYVMLATARNDKEGGLQRKLALADALGMTADAGHCARLDRLLQRVRFQVQVKFTPVDGRQCTLELQPQYRVDLAAGDHAILQGAQANMAQFGLQIDEAACRRYPASIGAEAFPFRLCPVTQRR